jgi:hypothetical protein
MAIIALAVHGIEAQARLEERDYRDAVDGVTFFVSAAPVVLVCASYGLFWCCKATFEIVRRKDFESLKAFLVVLMTWIAFPPLLRNMI